MMFEFNKDDTRRKELLGLEENCKYIHGGIEYFDDITFDVLKKLFDENFIDGEDAQNDDSPLADEIFKFLEKHKCFMVSGYAVSPDRDDYRITIDQISGTAVLLDDFNAFIEFARFADDFSCDSTSMECFAQWD